jgi:16S rRNA (uracil1498-N3)-methyltransferase
MNIILLAEHELVGHQANLVDHRAEHIIKILRSRAGDRVIVGIINGKIGYGIIKGIVSKQPFQVTLEVVLDREPPPVPAIDIVLALPRPIMFRRILSQLTALGVGHIHVLNSARVEKSFWDASIVTGGSWRKQVVAGLEQAVDTRLVEVSFHRGFKPFVERAIDDLAPGYRQMLVAHPDCPPVLQEVFQGGGGRTLVAIGPEGGWTRYEIDNLRERGFTAFGMGPRILRVDTAVPVIHAMVTLLQAQQAGAKAGGTIRAL